MCLVDTQGLLLHAVVPRSGYIQDADGGVLLNEHIVRACFHFLLKLYAVADQRPQSRKG